MITLTESSSVEVDDNMSSDNGAFPIAPVAGGIAGGVVLIAIIIAIAVCLSKRKKKNNADSALSAPLQPASSPRPAAVSGEFASARDESPRSQEYARFTANSTADLSMYTAGPPPAMTSSTIEYGAAPPPKSEYGSAPPMPTNYAAGIENYRVPAV